MHKSGRVPTGLPLHYPLDRKIGAGKDNRVYTLGQAETAEAIGPLVVKAGNRANPESRYYDVESAHNDLRFKKEKYHLLRTFLGEYVPQTAFFVGSQRNPDGETVIKPYSVQQRVPQFMLSDLTPDQRNSDALRSQMYGLALRLRNMHRTLNRARTIVEGQGDTFEVDASLDLGAFSRYIQDHVEEDPKQYNYNYMVAGYKSSPNLLVDPESMNLYCIDFGSGEWTDRLGSQMAVVYDIAAHDPIIRAHLPQAV
ncbi:MAG TPA: hypothetical protein VMY99_00645 [Nevskiaceae bacterium]|nr:hypothetical protein [Nevskiaceae bacterium]